MATTIKRIEKDFILKVLYDEKLPIMCNINRSEYVLTVVKISSPNEICLKLNRPIEDLHRRQKIEFIFDFRGQVITFNTVVTSVNKDIINVNAPEFFYKNLGRSFLRVPIPIDLKVEFTCLGDFYALSYPRINTYETGNLNSGTLNLDPNDLNNIKAHIELWAGTRASGHELVLFTDAEPTSTEEKVIAETGKCIFLSSTQGSFPKTDPDSKDPHPKSRLVTLEMFKDFLRRADVDSDFLDQACARFINAKYNDGIVSEIWVPILFHEYVLGYIHTWINKGSTLSLFDYKVVDTLYQYA
jgi:hypothetical protein